MFTGIVQKLCTVRSVSDLPDLRRIVLALDELAQTLATGASVAVNGTCLTVTDTHNGDVAFDVIAETLATTNLGGLQPDAGVNVERSFRVGDEIGGHILSGHVSDQVVLSKVAAGQNQRDLTFDVPSRWMKYLHHKGFVALDGASLTIANVDPAQSQITVCLIPETIARTTLGTYQTGAAVNLEVDAQTQAIVDTVERVLGDPEWQSRLKPSGKSG